jgi:REP element-mobilizing transposase RayT
MPKSRKRQVDDSATPYYHCMVRCVRRAYLCGTDKQSGKNYDHRKQWIVERMKLLTEVFAIEICAYAVMSNHYHVILHADPDQVKTWSEDEILHRWAKICIDP